MPRARKSGKTGPANGRGQPETATPLTGRVKHPFAGIYGQELPKSLLATSLEAGHFPSFLFSGPAGVGKRTMALLYAQAVNCEAGRTASAATGGALFDAPPVQLPAESRLPPCGECATCRAIARLTHPDVRLIMPLKPEGDSADEGKQLRDRQRIVDETLRMAAEYALGRSRPATETKWQISIHAIHWLRSEMAYAPMKARRRIIIIVDADAMNPVAANAFLKTLEEPQKETSFILITERGHKLLDTIRSRCQAVRFSYLTREEIIAALRARADALPVTPEAAQIAADVAGGSLRRALDYLQQPESFLLPEAIEFFTRETPTADYCRSLAEQADRIPVESLVDSLLFLYQQALHRQLGLPAHYIEQNPALRRQIENRDRGQIRSIETIRHRLELLLQAKREAEYNVNRRLFLFALLTALAEPVRR